MWIDVEVVDVHHIDVVVVGEIALVTVALQCTQHHHNTNTVYSAHHAVNFHQILLQNKNHFISV